LTAKKPAQFMKTSKYISKIQRAIIILTLTPRCPRAPWLSTMEAKVDMTKLETFRSRDIDDGMPWVLPKFDATVVLSERCRQALEAAESRCHDDIQQAQEAHDKELEASYRALYEREF
jgi:hypothetical protein